MGRRRRVPRPVAPSAPRRGSQRRRHRDRRGDHRTHHSAPPRAVRATRGGARARPGRLRDDGSEHRAPDRRARSLLRAARLAVRRGRRADRRRVGRALDRGDRTDRRRDRARRALPPAPGISLHGGRRRRARAGARGRTRRRARTRRGARRFGARALPVRGRRPLRRPGRDRPARLRARARGALHRRGRRAVRARAGGRDRRGRGARRGRRARPRRTRHRGHADARRARRDDPDARRRDDELRDRGQGGHAARRRALLGLRRALPLPAHRRRRRAPDPGGRRGPPDRPRSGSRDTPRRTRGVDPRAPARIRDRVALEPRALRARRRAPVHRPPARRAIALGRGRLLGNRPHLRNRGGAPALRSRDGGREPVGRAVLAAAAEAARERAPDRAREPRDRLALRRRPAAEQRWPRARARSGPHRALRTPAGGGVPRPARRPPLPLAALPASRLHRRLERRREDVGLPVPRRPLRADRQGALRAADRGARARLAGRRWRAGKDGKDEG